MAKIGGFDPSIGVQALVDGRTEIGHANLPGAARLLPGSFIDRPDALVYGKLTDSALLDMFAPYLALELTHRELLAPDVFFEALEQAAKSMQSDAGGGGESGEGPLVEAARALAEILADRELCQMLRNLVLKA